MKKSFLKRAMAAAIAVPVALSQTVLFSSFAADETATAAATGAGYSLDAATFTAVNPDVKANVPTQLAGTENIKGLSDISADYIFVQYSDWNVKAEGAMNAMAGKKFELDANTMINNINKDTWYTRILKDAAAANGVSAEAEIVDEAVEVTFSIDYDLAAAIVQTLQAGIPAKYQNIELEQAGEYQLAGTVVLTIGTEKIADKTITADVKVNLPGFTGSDAIEGAENFGADLIENIDKIANDSVKATIAKYRAELASAKAQLADADAELKQAQADLDAAEESGVDVAAKRAALAAARADWNEADAQVAQAEADLDDAEHLADGEIDKVVNNFKKTYNDAKKAADKGAKFQLNPDDTVFEAATTDELLGQIKDYVVAVAPTKGQAFPGSIAELKQVKGYDAVASSFDAIFAQVDSQVSTVNVDLTVDSILAEAQSATDITATANGTNYAYTAEAWGYLPDEVTDLEAAYAEYIQSQIPEDKVIDGKIGSVKVFNADTDVDAAALEGTAAWDVYRIFYVNVKDAETTTTEESTTIESTTTESTTTESTTSTEESTTTESTTSTEESTTTESTTTESTTTESTTTESTTTESTTTESTTTESTMTESTTTESTTTTETSGDGKVHADNITVEVKTEGNFYFSHDPNEFDPTELILSAKATVTNADGTTEEVTLNAADFAFAPDDKGAITDLTPADYYANTLKPAGNVSGALNVYYNLKNEDGSDNYVLVPGAFVTVYVAVKGDVDFNGVANAADASKILVYAANAGLNPDTTFIYSEEDADLEEFAYFLGDVNGESTDYGKTDAKGNESSPLNAADASYVLIYAAKDGLKEEAGTTQWIPEVLTDSANYPKFSEAIAIKKGLIQG